ncbi:MAG: DUF3826 domain-containing protein [Prevotellaceae bacterium]|jgi:hypothetical protein|nr:DUF3826 domain-containing protein [Prevotellaceae bacterium]
MKMLHFLTISLALCTSLGAAAQGAPTAADKDEAYMKVVTERAAKIVATLDIVDSAKLIRVRGIIAHQYRDLNAVHDARNVIVQELKEDSLGSKAATVKAVENEATAKLYGLHCAYIGKLASELSPEQVDKVKDGMTYGVAPLTYRVQCEMIPTLTDEQKRYVHAALTEAREHAMDAESSNKKHEWFGKYKGRINNYLSAQGYDLKKEREAWGDRGKQQGAAGQQ